MGDVNHEPTMEEILASIKKIIAEDGETAVAARVPRRRDVSEPVAAPVATDDEINAVASDDGEAEADAADVLELTDAVSADDEVGVAEEEPIVSEEAAESAHTALAALSAMSGGDHHSDVAGSTALEGVVRDMLRPMLKEWLDANLPGMVEQMVAREIARIANIPK